MTAFIQWITKFFGAWKPWIVVKPWEIGVRVRLGKTAKELRPGVHFRIPILDHIEAINTRLRIVPTPSITLTNGRAGFATVRTATIAFRVEDPLAAMMTYTDPEAVVISKTQAVMVDNESAAACEEALSDLKGIKVDSVRFVENVNVRTFRLLQNQWQHQGREEKEKF